MILNWELLWDQTSQIFMDLHNLPPTDTMQPGDSPLHAENRSGQGNLRKSDKGGKGKNLRKTAVGSPAPRFSEWGNLEGSPRGGGDREGGRNGAENTHQGGAVYARARTLGQVLAKSLANGIYTPTRLQKFPQRTKPPMWPPKPSLGRISVDVRIVWRDNFRGPGQRAKGEGGEVWGRAQKVGVGTLYSG